VRPALLPAHRPLWRDAATLQLGRCGARAAVVSGLDPTLRPVLDLLDGSYDRATVLSAAAVQGCDPDRAKALVDLLVEAGLVEDAAQDRAALLGLRADERERLSADLASLALVRGDGGLPALALRRDVQVLVVGAGRVGAPLAVALALAGSARSTSPTTGAPARRTPASAGSGCPTSAGRAVRPPASWCIAPPRRCHGCRSRARTSSCSRPGATTSASGRRLVLDGHGPPAGRGAGGAPGRRPLVLPGRTPCLRCLDLTAATSTRPGPCWPTSCRRPGGRAGCDGPLALAVAARRRCRSSRWPTAHPSGALGGTLRWAARLALAAAALAGAPDCGGRGRRARARPAGPRQRGLAAAATLEG
jgi:hypothetical protein